MYGTGRVTPIKRAGEVEPNSTTRLPISIFECCGSRYQGMAFDCQKNFNTGGRIGYENVDDARIANIEIFRHVKRPSKLAFPLAAICGGARSHTNGPFLEGTPLPSRADGVGNPAVTGL
jgi:hypothetical protein